MIATHYLRGLIFILLTVALAPCATAQEMEQEQMPLADVVVSKVTTGTIAPEGEFIATVYYLEVSDIPSEVNGTGEIIAFEEGERKREGELLIKLDSTLLEKNLQAQVALYEQVLSDLERARKDLERVENLYRKKMVAEKAYDDQRFQVKGLEKKSAALKAEVERLEIELEKTVINAPFDGVIIKKHIARGEWLSPGKTVATIARDDAVDILVEVPEEVIRYLRGGMRVEVTAAGRKKTGTITAIIAKGDIATRTFPIKIRIGNPNSLMEGMEARAKLPVGERVNVLFVPRDAVLTLSGKTVVVAVVNSRAMLIPTHVIGYQGLKAGINADEISEGMEVVVKGNERLRNGQPVRIIREGK